MSPGMLVVGGILALLVVARVAPKLYEAYKARKANEDGTQPVGSTLSPLARLKSALSLDDLSTDLAGMLKRVNRTATLSPPGRAALSDVMIFLEHPISLYPPGPKRDEAQRARQVIYDLFGSAPTDPVEEPKPAIVPEPEPIKPAVT